jgi:hypothetical protein
LIKISELKGLLRVCVGGVEMEEVGITVDESEMVDDIKDEGLILL